MKEGGGVRREVLWQGIVIKLLVERINMSLKMAEEEVVSPKRDTTEPNKFQELMKCAVAVKSSQIASKRRRFD